MLFRPSFRKILFNAFFQPFRWFGVVFMFVIGDILIFVQWILRIGAGVVLIIDFVYLFNGGQSFIQFLLILLGDAIAFFLSWPVGWFVDIIGKFFGTILPDFIENWNDNEENRVLDIRIARMNKRYDRKQARKAKKEQKQVEKREKYNARVSKRSRS